MTHTHKNLVLLIIFGSWASCSSVSSPSQKHEEWMAQHGRRYINNKEKVERFEIFKANLETIEKFNNASKETYQLGINEFADLTSEEFLAAHTGLKMSQQPQHQSSTTSFRFHNLTDIPPTVDWRDHGAVTPVKNQGSCGCCWAFSAVAAIEGLVQIKTGQLISLSEQELVDCSNNNNGCIGGTMFRAYKYIIQNKGIATETNYPYRETKGACDLVGTSPLAAHINGYENVSSNNELALLKAVIRQPVSVGIHGHGSAFRFYKTGVFTGDCGITLTHAVIIVGYGSTEEGTTYWILKNSWGKSWGENGYMRIKRDSGSPQGLCGLAMHPSYPTI